MLRLFAALVLLTSGCSVNQPTATSAQALARVEQLIHETADILTPKPRLESVPSFEVPSTCWDEDKSQDQIIVSRAYWLRDVPKSENMSISQQVRAHWEAAGHRIVASGRAGNPDLSGESQPDGFTLTLTWAEGDNLYLGAASPCVWPDGHPSE
ncbi:hypothetical protein [Nonomuraea roseoviolacea]|uniref:Lipoprotein n=1 Tax=Nonomuraea roseoviolacea subsp. carminata TaxID=160689 RepID=A0ABT1K518_9ACTN|nr:hypothetical protein [Nonomuraea roseoviolacea]MCP2349106.1 hypothetical protein [Nonomuraea roseoviolacea subsp. carminata]